MTFNIKIGQYYMFGISVYAKQFFTNLVNFSESPVFFWTPCLLFLKPCAIF